MKEQLNLMGAIYANATASIVATDEDSQDGLAGLKIVSPSRELAQLVIPWDLTVHDRKHKYVLTKEDGNNPGERQWN